MSHKVVTLVYSRSVGSAHRKAILAYMADRASDDGRGVFCSKGTIANETEIARSTVFKTIKDMVAEGILIEAGSRPCRNGVTVVYDLNLVAIARFPLVKSDGENAIDYASTSPSPGLVREVTSPGAGPHQSGSRTPTSPGAGPKPPLEPSLNIEEPLCVSPKPKTQRRKPEVPLPENWVPSDRNIADATARQFSAKEIEHEASRFRDHHHSKDSRFRDWDAAWRTWLGNARKFATRGVAQRTQPGGGGRGSSIASIVARRRIEAGSGSSFPA